MRAGRNGSSSGTQLSTSHLLLATAREPYLTCLRCRIPLYPYIRLLFLLYLVLPQTQGARIIYTTYVHPYLEDNESQIEDLIATAHDKMKAAGMAYLKRAIELLRTQVLGMAPSADAQGASAESNVPASQQPRSYTQSLLERFQLPAARWPANSGAGSPGQDFYSFLASAVAAATGAGANAPPKENNNDTPTSSLADLSAAGAFPAGDLTASGTLVPPSIRDNAEKMTFLAAQRERLNLVLSALDREAAQLRSPGPIAAPEANLDAAQPERPATSASGKSALSKSRSEADFEKIEAESGAEDNAAQDSETARPTPAARSGSWMPWGWGTSAASGDKSKAE